MDWKLVLTIVVSYIIARAIVGIWKITFSLMAFRSEEHQELVGTLEDILKK